MLHWKRMLDAKPAEHEPQPHKTLFTPWGERIAEASQTDPTYVPLSDHPRPQFARDNWTCLNGWGAQDAFRVAISSLPRSSILWFRMSMAILSPSWI